MNAVNMEQDRHEWECELRLNWPHLEQYRHLLSVAFGSRQFWPDNCLRLDAFWSSLGTSIGITRSISQWPTHDGFLLYSDAELSVRVGTIRSAADARYRHVDMVISLCPLSPLEGTPQTAAGWQSHFSDLCIEHFPFPHRDTRYLRGEDLRVEVREVASLRTLWGRLFYDTTTARWRIQRGSGHLHILFHCFAGINRSTAAAIAFLMQECNSPFRVLINKLCQVRPGQEYCRDRDQFLLALLRLDQDLTLSTSYRIRFL